MNSASPHDCRDTCSMLVTVEDGKATKVADNPDYPFTQGTPCSNVSDYIRFVPVVSGTVTVEGRLRLCLLREGEWDALMLVRAGLAIAKGQKLFARPNLHTNNQAMYLIDGL
ncbi:hypothetical protein SPB21_00825 [Leptothoe sp. ISB3NOV94-8A]